MKPPSRAEMESVSAKFWQDYRRSQWHSHYSEPTEAMYGVINAHGGHVMWPKYSDAGYNVYFLGPPAGSYAVHVYKSRLFDGGIYSSLKTAKLAAWGMRRLYPDNETDFAIQVIGENRKQYLFIGGFTGKWEKLAFDAIERKRTASRMQLIEDAKRRYQPWTKGKRK